MSESTAPRFDESSNTITIPEVEHVEYLIGGLPVKGEVVIKKNTTVRVRAKRGYVLADSVEKEHRFTAAKLDDPKGSSDEKPAPAEPVVVDTAGSTPENAGQQAFKTEGRVSGSNQR